MNDGTHALGWEVQGNPYARATVTARVDLGLQWRFLPSALRGAILEEVARISGGNERLHSDWNGRLGGEEGETISRIPPILYRVRGDAAHLYFWGPRTAERLAELGRVEAVTDPENRRILVEISINSRTEETALTPRAWHRYESVSPWWPPARVWGRKPPHDAPQCVWNAWAADALSMGILGLFRALGVPEETSGERTRLTVSVADMRCVPVVWHRDSKDIHHESVGFMVRFVANCALPDGIMLGKHGAEGYGEIRYVDCTRIER